MNDVVTLTFAADTRNVSLARTVAAAMSARADLPVDQLEDVRLAVDEAVSQLIDDAPDDSRITCVFTNGAEGLDIRLSAPTKTGRPPSTDTFSWTVLTALVEDVTADVTDGTLTLLLHVVRGISVDA
jgi:serine/threonine-protein kinase RsbW